MPCEPPVTMAVFVFNYVSPSIYREKAQLEAARLRQHIKLLESLRPRGGFGGRRPYHSLKISLMEVFARVLASTVFTITAQ